MKLQSLFESEEIYHEREYVITLRKYLVNRSSFTGVKKSAQVDEAATQLLKTPRYIYRGEMYRVLPIKVLEFIEQPSIMTINRQLEQRAAKVGRSFSAWSKNYTEVFTFFSEDMFQGDEPIKAAIMYEQNGVGLDGAKLMDPRFQAGARDTDAENTVLAQFQMTSIYGFLVDTPGGAKYFKPSDFQQVVTVLRKMMRF